MMSSSEHADTNHRGYSHMDPEYPECDPCETNASDGMLTQENEEMQERVIALEKKVQAQEDEIMCLKSALSDVIRRLQAVESGRGVQNNILPSMPKMGSGSQNSPRRMPMTARSAAPSTRRAMSAEHVSSVQRYSSPTPNRIVPRNHPGGGAGGGGGGGASAGGGGSSRKWTSSPSVNEAMNGHMSPGSPAQLSPVSPMAPSTPTGAAPTSISVSPAPSLTSLTPLSPAYSGEQRASVRRSGSLSSLTGRMSPSPFTIRYKEPIYNPDDKCLRMFLRGRAVNMYAPSSLEDYQVGKPLDAPTQKLRLEWVYGYRGRDARSNLYLLPTGEIVYFVAAVVVLYNVEEQMQRHYLGHNDDVKCLALHPDRLRIATGQVAGHDKKEGRPHIRIWNSVNLQTLKVIGLGEFDRAVSCLAFSKADGGQFLAAVDEANEHVLSLWDWEKGEKGHKVTETKSSTEPVLAIEFHPCEKNIIVTCGKGQLSFWNMEGSMLTRKMGIYERFEKPKFVTCLAFAENGDTITGDSNGNIFVWGRGTNKITHSMIGAHEGGIFSVCVMKNGLILTGGKDRRIVQWDNNYKKTGQEHELPEMYGPVRMLSQGKGNMVLVGTTKNSILQGSLDFKFSTIVQGHVDELWGLAVHPSQHQFVSTGYDRNLYVWDALTHTTVWCKELPDGAHCACFHPDGGIIVVGTLCGRWLVMDNTAHDIITTHTDGSEILGAMAFSPDGRLLAIGSRDNNIYIYGVSEGGRKYIKNGKCSGHSSFITHLDWSLDSQWLQSNSGDYEILFWNPETCRQVTAASTLRDVEWSSHSCTLGFNVAGIWPEGADGTDVNACARSNKKHLVASADDFGKVNLYTYPCSQPKSTATIYNGHSSHVTNVNFLCDDSRLLSTGGKDTAILQWEVMD